MSLLIGGTYLIVKAALDRNAIQQEISFFTNQQFIRFQQLANQTRSLMRASADATLPDYILESMEGEIKGKADSVRQTMSQLESMQQQLDGSMLERFKSEDVEYERLRADLNRQIGDFLERVGRVVEASRDERMRRYSFWGPIDFAVSADSQFMRQFYELVLNAHRRSGAAVDNAMLISTLLLSILAALLILAALFLFSPLLTRLRNEHHRKMEFEQRLTHLAQTDALTALKNRAFFNDALRELLRRFREEDEGFSMLLIDLDHFKTINDNFGHPAGDATLRHVAGAFQRSCRGRDIITRLGGDEFAVLLPGLVDAGKLKAVADRIVEAIGDEFRFEQHTLSLSASIGGAIVPSHATDEAGLVRIVDLALYEAKASRNGVVIFDEETLATQLKQTELAAALVGAAERNEFVVFYQPKVGVDSGEHLGFEALVRWNHPSLGILAPGAFLPLLDGTGLIREMTRAVVRGVCRDIKAWKAAGLNPGPVAINVPEELLVSDQGVGIFTSALDEFGLAWRDIAVEVTEDVFLNRYAERMFESITRFRRKGVPVSLDDFGTGFASLVHLRDFPFDELKIDRGFVSDIGVDTRSEQIVRTIVDLARNLGKACVAEGIETETQLRFLQQLGCRVGQGYLFAKPLPAREATEWLAADRSRVIDGDAGALVGCPVQ
ncbi:EAL domain-containing protein [Marinobacterium sp. D7]|uniref:putative bifunctional diguanylate cyclase/phosphodiesterase n=1 Tax=Marinobacterium ramblicola TaxID=2849041 RepID=UPI001C2DD91F|nr:EAL domain-containing protein [Marinobacterium ramblicola]MBV1786862.1 EAL domain-containing protein [Marinobacterium ramblicola]